MCILYFINYQKMKLLFFVDSLIYSGGIQRMLTNKVNYLSSKEEYEVHIICYDKPHSQPFFSLNDNIRVHFINIENFQKTLLEKISYLPKMIRNTLKLVKTINPDMIINENMKTMTFLLPLIIKKIPLIYVIHFSFDGLMQMSRNIYKNKIIRRYINSIRFFILKKYTRFVVLTEEDKTKWRLPNCQVIPNFTCINNSFQSKLTNKTAIFVGRFSPEKDLPTLIKAWKIVSETEPEWKLELYGDGIEKEKIISLIQKLKLEKFVYLKGKSSDIEEAYRNSSLLVLTSKFEGFVLVALEALTMGVPCITFDIPGCNNMIENGINGFLVKEHSHIKMGNKILEYIQSNSSEKYAMQQRIPETIKKFSIDFVMQQWIDLFHTCINKNKFKQ